jgi:hypothetical protein
VAWADWCLTFGPAITVRRPGPDVTLTVPAHPRLAFDALRAVGTRGEPRGSRGAVDFCLARGGCGEDEYTQGPQQAADEEPPAGLPPLCAQMVIPAYPENRAPMKATTITRSCTLLPVLVNISLTLLARVRTAGLASDMTAAAAGPGRAEDRQPESSGPASR